MCSFGRDVDDNAILFLREKCTISLEDTQLYMYDELIVLHCSSNAERTVCHNTITHVIAIEYC